MTAAHFAGSSRDNFLTFRFQARRDFRGFAPSRIGRAGESKTILFMRKFSYELGEETHPTVPFASVLKERILPA